MCKKCGIDFKDAFCLSLTKKKFFAGVITEEMFESQQNADIISTLTREFDEVRMEEEKTTMYSLICFSRCWNGNQLIYLFAFCLVILQ